MFGWFFAKCPVDTWEKTWTEWRMRWLAEKFGVERLLRAEVLLPTEQFFPDPYRGTEEDANRLYDRLCGYLAINDRNIRLEVVQDVQMPGAVGHYDRSEKTVIRVAASQLADPMRLVATLCHELAHELLLGGGLLTTEISDHEWVTDLLPVFLGAGVFAANATVKETHDRVGNVSWWSMGKQGYLPARVFGYAFALFAFMRGEKSPAWAEHLRLDASSALRDGLRFLHRTDDSLFHPDTIRAYRRPATAGVLSDRLRESSSSVRLSSLWEISEQVETDPCVVQAVTHCLHDRDPAISAAAGRTLGALGAAAAGAVPDLVQALSSANDETRAGAAFALGVLGEQPDTVIPELGFLLKDEDSTVVCDAALALRRFSLRAESAFPQLLAAFSTALIKADYLVLEILAGTLLAVTPEAMRLVGEHFSADDPELRQLALEAMKEMAVTQH